MQRKGVVWFKSAGCGQACASIVTINDFFQVIATGKSTATKPGCYKSKQNALKAASAWVNGAAQ